MDGASGGSILCSDEANEEQNYLQYIEIQARIVRQI
jgi:hypothetical protein